MEYIVFLALVIGVMWLARQSDTSSSNAYRRRGYRAAADLSTAFESFWLPQDRSIAIHGYSIEGGLLYVGKDLASVNGYSVEPALIDPKLKVNSKHPDHSGEGMNYWPAYGEISPRNRAGYLAWLANGRNDPNAYIGYVFLYFYGLERRILYDHKHGAEDNEEWDTIFNEVKRLLDLYGDNSSFGRYAQQFLFTIYLSTGQIDLMRTKPVIAPSVYELPALIKIGLGQFSKAGQAIPADWALAWVSQDPEIRLRTPARRCRKEFAALFKQLYRERHGEGIVVKPNKTPVSATYRPASGGIGGAFEIYQGPTLPDITVLKRPRTMLADLVDQACDKLDPYSRFIGKDDSGRGGLQSLALLPAELAGTINHPGLETLRSTLESHLKDNDARMLPVQTVLHHFPIQKPDRFSKKEAVLLAQLLEKVGLGMEPDVRFTGIKPGPDEQLVVFKQDADAPSAPSQAYEAASLLMRLAAMVCAADGEISPEEKQHLERHIETSLLLEPGERRRLHAHLEWLLVHEKGMAGLKAKLDNLTAPERETIGQYLVTVAAADGYFDPGEVKILQKLYRPLGLDPDQVVGIMHSASAEPVTVRPATPHPGHPIPEKPKESAEVPTGTNRAALDPAALQRKLEDTARVSDMLHSIFTDEVPEATFEPDRPEITDALTIDGLDAEHSAFVHALGKHEIWERAGLETLAEHHGLLLDGALDTINDAAFDQCDAPCIDEDNDSYVVDRAIYEEMTT